VNRSQERGWGEGGACDSLLHLTRREKGCKGRERRDPHNTHFYDSPSLSFCPAKRGEKKKKTSKGGRKKKGRAIHVMYSSYSHNSF